MNKFHYYSGNGDDVEMESEVPRCSSVVLSRFLFTCGHVALQELIHLDVAVFGELKRRRAVCEANKQSKTDAGKGSKSKNASSVSVAASATRSHKVCIVQSHIVCARVQFAGLVMITCLL